MTYVSGDENSLPFSHLELSMIDFANLDDLDPEEDGPLCMALDMPAVQPVWVPELAKLQAMQCVPKLDTKPKRKRKSKKWSMMNTADIYGQLGMVMCWYWDWEGGEGTFKDAIRAVKLIPRFLEGRTQAFSQSDWWLFLDALGSYPDRTPAMDEMFLLADQGYRGVLPESKKTKDFSTADLEDGNFGFPWF